MAADPINLQKRRESFASKGGVNDDQSPYLPQNVEAEAAIMAEIMADGGDRDVLAQLKREHFYLSTHRILWDARDRCLERFGAIGEPFGFVEIVDELMTMGHLGPGKTFEDTAAVSALARRPESGTLFSWIRIVRERYVERLTLHWNGKLAAVATNEPAKLPAFLREMHETLEAEMLDAPTSGRFRLHSIQELRDRPRPEWLIPGVVQERKNTLVFGPSNVGKSFLTLDMGLRWSIERGHVVYVCAEGLDGIAPRVDAWLAYHGHDDAPRFHVIAESPDLIEMGDVEEIIAEVKTLGEPVVAVFYDTLSASMEGHNENAPEDMTAAVRGIKRTQHELDCAVVVVHHQGKDTIKGARGHSSLRAAMDTAIEVTLEDATGVVTAKCDKMRDAKKFQSRTYRLRNMADDTTGADLSCVIVPLTADESIAQKQQAQVQAMNPAQRIILTTLRDQFPTNGASAEELRKAANDMPNTTFYRYLRGDSKTVGMLQLGLVRESTQNRTKFYFLTEDGRMLITPTHSQTTPTGALVELPPLPHPYRGGSGGSDSGSPATEQAVWEYETGDER